MSSSPGGQPSTMQPSAGPWLSPKVVTVNSLPKVLPDMRVSACLAVVRASAGTPRPRRARIPATRTAACERPGAPPSPCCPPRPPAARAAPGAAAASRRMIETESSPAVPAASATRGSCRYSGGRPLQLARPDVGRIADDNIVGAAPQGREVVRRIRRTRRPSRCARTLLRATRQRIGVRCPPHRPAPGEMLWRRQSRCSRSRCPGPGSAARAPGRSRAQSRARSVPRSASAE